MEYESFSAKTVEDALEAAAESLGTTPDMIEYEIVDRGSAGLLGLGSRKATIRARKKESEEPCEESGEKTAPDAIAAGFLRKVLDSMNMVDVEVSATYDEADSSVRMELLGDNMGIFIGKHGQTLDSLQYLTNLVLNRHTDDYVRVYIDVENYRGRREMSLEIMAQNVAHKVKKYNSSMSLEPMNPNERRIIHTVLQKDEDVITESEGDEPYRHVVVRPASEADGNKSMPKPYSSSSRRVGYRDYTRS